MIRYYNNGSFICERCRKTCMANCHDTLTKMMNGELKEGDKDYAEDLIGRKNIIKCLGKYCDKPCAHQMEDYTPFNEGDELTPLFTLIDYLGQKTHNLLDENIKLKKAITNLERENKKAN